MAPADKSEAKGGVYVLRLQKQIDGEHCYYVGKAADKARRMAQHQSGQGSAAWVKHCGGVLEELEPVMPAEELSTWEMKETMTRVIMHGFANVRGWEWTRVAGFTPEDYSAFKINAFGMGDLCRKCGNSGHFAMACGNREKAACCVAAGV